MKTLNKNTVFICVTAIIVTLVYYWTNTADLREIKDYCHKAMQKSKDAAISSYEYCNKELSKYNVIISLECEDKDGHLSAEEFKVRNDKKFSLAYSKCIMNVQEDLKQ